MLDQKEAMVATQPRVLNRFEHAGTVHFFGFPKIGWDESPKYPVNLVCSACSMWYSCHCCDVAPQVVWWVLMEPSPHH